jgi:hypothetical protein
MVSESDSDECAVISIGLDTHATHAAPKRRPQTKHRVQRVAREGLRVDCKDKAAAERALVGVGCWCVCLLLGFGSLEEGVSSESERRETASSPSKDS